MSRKKNNNCSLILAIQPVIYSPTHEKLFCFTLVQLWYSMSVKKWICVVKNAEFWKCEVFEHNSFPLLLYLYPSIYLSIYTHFLFLFLRLIRGHVPTATLVSKMVLFIPTVLILVSLIDWLPLQGVTLPSMLRFWKKKRRFYQIKRKTACPPVPSGIINYPINRSTTRAHLRGYFK